MQSIHEMGNPIAFTGVVFFFFFSKYDLHITETIWVHNDLSCHFDFLDL
jgi:hypothetical protein